jgi:hypothetical protein
MLTKCCSGSGSVDWTARFALRLAARTTPVSTLPEEALAREARRRRSHHLGLAFSVPRRIEALRQAWEVGRLGVRDGEDHAVNVGREDGASTRVGRGRAGCEPSTTTSRASSTTTSQPASTTTSKPVTTTTSKPVTSVVDLARRERVDAPSRVVTAREHLLVRRYSGARGSRPCREFSTSIGARTDILPPRRVSAFAIPTSDGIVTLDDWSG